MGRAASSTPHTVRYANFLSLGWVICQWTVCTLINSLILILFFKKYDPIKYPRKKIFASPWLYKLLNKFLSSLLIHGYVPKSLSIVKIIPILKNTLNDSTTFRYLQRDLKFLKEIIYVECRSFWGLQTISSVSYKILLQYVVSERGYYLLLGFELLCIRMLHRH